MDGEVIIGIPVSPEAAELLRDKDRARVAGQLLSSIIHPTSPEADPLAPMIAELKSDARTDGLTDEEIESELSAYNAERRT